MEITQGGPPHFVRSGDGGNILSFVVGRLHPDAFANDPLLHAPGNTDFYRTFVTGWTSVVGQLAAGDFAFAYLLLAIPCVFLHLTGFYWLFRLLGLSVAAGALASLALLATVPSAIGTYWGGFTDPQPRFLFQSMLPFFLVAAWHWRSLPSRWAPLFVALGLMTYVHPVSGPAVAFAVWCGLAAEALSDDRRRRRIAQLVLVGFVYLLVIAPFAYLYTSVGENARDVAASSDQVFAIAEQRFAPGYLDLPRLLAESTMTTWVHPRGAVALGAVLVAAWLWRRGGEDRAFARLFAGLFAGLAVVSILIPMIDHFVAAWLDRYPIQVDLVRNIRYFIPLSLVLAFVGGSRFLDSWKPRYKFAFAPMLAAAWMAANPIAWSIGAGSPIGTVIQTARCVVSPGHCQDPVAARQPYRELIGFLRRNTAAGESLFATDGDHTLRYAALRSLVFSDKDGGAFAYANHNALLQWHQIAERNRSVASLPEPELRLEGWLDLARTLGADYLVSDRPIASNWSLEGSRLMFQNDRYAVLSLSEQGND